VHYKYSTQGQTVNHFYLDIQSCLHDAVHCKRQRKWLPGACNLPQQYTVTLDPIAVAAIFSRKPPAIYP
jgi:hypothetical protein